jgi:hypothetical protein
MAGEFEQITNALKIAYPPKAIEPMVNDEAPFRKALKKSVPAGSNKASEGILKFGGALNPPQNQGQLVDGGTLPAPKNRDDVQFQLTPTLFAGGLQIGMITKSAANSNKSAFNRGELRRRTEETIADLGKFIEQTYAGTHGTGRRARVESDGSNTFVAALPEGTTLLRENQYITVRTTDGGATVRDSCDYRKITAINHDTRTVTYDGADQTLVAGDHVHPVVEASQSFTTNPFANGVRGLVDDATYLTTVHGLSRVTYPKLKSVVNSNGGVNRNLTEQILIRTLNTVRARTGKRITDMWTGPGQFEKYIEFVSADRRYPVTGSSPQSMVTGYTNLVHVTPEGPLKLNLSFDIIPRELYLFNWDTFFHYVSEEMDWWQGDMLKPTPTSGGFKASYMAYLVSIENIGCDMPLANAVIRDLRDPSIGDA